MIRIENLSVIYRSGKIVHHAVRDVSISVEQGRFYTLLGPSGCGKTTTLRAVAGLEKPVGGRIFVGDVLVNDPANGVFVEPNDRNIGMVFQSYAIWPHMTVFENVAFPLRQVKPRPSADTMNKLVRDALALVQLDGLESRPAPYLSGGQQQRLALARALVFEPRVLLLDEPLSNLDAKLREDMRGEIAELVRRLRITTLFVTHEQIEALTMSDVVGLMRDGLIIQEGTPEEIYARPKERFVADFIGKINTIEGSVIAQERPDRYTVETPAGVFAVRGQAPVPVNQKLLLAIRPEDWRIAGEAADNVNSFNAVVSKVSFLGNIAECFVKVHEQQFRLQIHPLSVPAVGSRVTIVVDPAEVRGLSN